MKSIRILAALALVAAPLLVSAQTSNTPGGSASTGTPLDQTKKDPGSAPSTTATTPTTSNPNGKLTGSHKQGKHTKKATTDAAVGDVPTYPAPARDGTPTK